MNDPEDRRNEHDRDPDLQRDPRSVNDSRKNIAAEAVRAEPMFGRRRRISHREILRRHIVRRDQRRKDRRQDKRCAAIAMPM